MHVCDTEKRRESSSLKLFASFGKCNNSKVDVVRVARHELFNHSHGILCHVIRIEN